MTRQVHLLFAWLFAVVLVGLASKNAILIVEFAKVKRVEGLSAHDAAAEACRVRLRPIVMTSFVFIFGVVALTPGPRGRGRDALRAGRRRVRRHDRGNRVRHLHDAGVFWWVFCYLVKAGANSQRNAATNSWIWPMVYSTITLARFRSRINRVHKVSADFSP
jgi:hypothetical protein